MQKSEKNQAREVQAGDARSGESALDELSRTLGVLVEVVDRTEQPDYYRPAGDRASLVWVVRREDNPIGVTFTTADMRSVERINDVCRRLGRPKGLKALTSKDARKALRLMHEVMEAENAAAADAGDAGVRKGTKKR